MSESTQQTSLFEASGRKITVWVDATCRKPDYSDATDAYGCIIKDSDSEEVKKAQGQINYEDECTPQVAEYKAIINGIEEVYDKYSSVGVLQVYTDAETPAKQVGGHYNVNHQHLQSLKRRVNTLRSNFDQCNIDWKNKTQSPKLQQADDLAEDAASGEKA